MFEIFKNRAKLVNENAYLSRLVDKKRAESARYEQRWRCAVKRIEVLELELLKLREKAIDDKERYIEVLKKMLKMMEDNERGYDERYLED